MKHSEVFDILKPAALDLAEERFRHVAAIVYKNKIVSFGTSHMKSHPFQARYSKNDSFSLSVCINDIFLGTIRNNTRNQNQTKR